MTETEPHHTGPVTDHAYRYGHNTNSPEGLCAFRGTCGRPAGEHLRARTRATWAGGSSTKRRDSHA